MHDLVVGSEVAACSACRVNTGTASVRTDRGLCDVAPPCGLWRQYVLSRLLLGGLHAALMTHLPPVSLRAFGFVACGSLESRVRRIISLVTV